ncbi:MAG: ATP-binding protein, partial [Pseudohongiella sp.]|nr:ATP-binding protein [Pseudohongiella sp.]
MMSITALLEGYNEAEYDGEIRLSPCAYLHNYPDHDGAITDPIYADHIRRAPMFLKGDVERRRLQDFIKTHVRWGDRGQTLYAIELGRIRPSKSLADALAGLMKG